MSIEVIYGIYAIYALTLIMTDKSATSTVMLRTPADWGKWRAQLRQKASSLGIWEEIDPSIADGARIRTTKSMGIRPKAPKLSDYAMKQSAVTQWIRDHTEEGSPAPSPDEARATRISQLSEESVKQLEYDEKVYNREYREYESDKKAVKELVTWIQSTVDAAATAICCNDDEPIHIWIKNLEATVGIPPYEEKELAVAKYEKVMRKAMDYKITDMRELEKWMAEWEVAMQEGIRVEWYLARKTSEWFSPLMKALRYTPLATWVESYETSNRTLANTDALLYRDVTSAIRARIAAEPERPRAKAARGVFGPVATAIHSDDGDRVRKEPTRGPREGYTPRESIKCLLCGLIGHKLAKCYFVGKVRPRFTWRPRWEVVNHVRKALTDQRTKEKLKEEDIPAAAIWKKLEEIDAAKKAEKQPDGEAK